MRYVNQASFVRAVLRGNLAQANKQSRVCPVCGRNVITEIGAPMPQHLTPSFAPCPGKAQTETPLGAQADGE